MLLDACVVKKWKAVIDETVCSFSLGPVKAFPEGVLTDFYV